MPTAESISNARHVHEAGAEVMAHGGFKITGGYKISVPWTPQAALGYMDRQQIAAQVISMPVSFAGSEKDRSSAPGCAG